MRRRFTAKQKTQTVLEFLREEKTIAQMVSEYGVHPTQLHRLKKTGPGALVSMDGRSRVADNIFTERL